MGGALNAGESTGKSCVRVSKLNPCPVCGKPDWCLVSQDGATAICARIESGRPIGNNGAGWLHRLADTSRSLTSSKRASDSRQSPKATPDVLDTAYRALLGEVALSGAHRDNLRRRGLTDADITRLGYKTLPLNGRGAIVEKLQGVPLTGVPGFWLHGGEVRMAGPAGIAIPVRDLRGRIQGLQVRRDDTEGGKYRWVSSRGYDRGCSPGVPVHVARPPSVAEAGEVWVTEGPLKADIASLKLGRVFLAVAGVSNWPGVKPVLQELAPSRVIVGFDQDKDKNPAVRLHTDRLIGSLLKQGLRCFEANWDQTKKGLDDLLLGDGHD